MKNGQLNLKTSPEDSEILQKAANRLHIETGEKPNISKTIRASVKEFADKPPVTNEPELFMINRAGIRDVDNNVNYGLVHLNKFIDEFKTVTGCLLTFDELQNLFEGAGKLGSEGIIQRAIRETVKTKLFQRLVENHPDMTVTIDNIPDKDLTVLYEIASEIDNMPEVENRFAGVYFSCYKLKGEKLEIIPAEVERLKDGYRKFASSVLQKQKLSHVRQLIAVLNSFLDDPEVIPENLISVFYYDPESRKFEPTGNYVLQSLKPNILFTKY